MQSVLETNVFGMMRVTNAMLPLPRRATSPSIVNIQQHGILGTANRLVLTAYASSKAMLKSITTQYVRAFNDTNIIINAVCPGYVATDFTEFAAPRTAGQGAPVAVNFGPLPDDGPRGGFFDDGGAVP
jgi:NAD(P)-dependent dehydrogenase (short-subunit alcohol dehydrogenase family)